MRFKEWLLKEEFGSFDSDNDSELFTPAMGGDYAYANRDPGDVWWLQWRFDVAKDRGRKFHNIDYKKFMDINYVSLKSNTMPDSSPGFWRHSSKERPSLTPKTSDLAQRGVSESPYEDNALKQVPFVQCWLPLNQMFGDKPSGKWPEAAEDKPWH